MAAAKVMFEPENFRVYPSDTSFLEFETGVKFTFDPSGNFTIRDRNGTLWEIPPQQRKGANLLIYQGDGVLCTKDASDAIIWKAPVAVVTGQLILSQSKPYLELKSVFGGEGFDGFKAVA